MSLSIQQLRALSDDDLITRHDAAAEFVQVGVDYYLEEFRRREQIAALRSSHRLARAAFWLTVTNTVLAVVAVVVSLAS
ncbi:MAG: hypothetical protein M3381_14420 [Actinomycetota bacterium]|nr:hypothetical protein [Actinomycetota bacterium]